MIELKTGTTVNIFGIDFIVERLRRDRSFELGVSVYLKPKTIKDEVALKLSNSKVRDLQDLDFIYDGKPCVVSWSLNEPLGSLFTTDDGHQYSCFFVYKDLVIETLSWQV